MPVTQGVVPLTVSFTDASIGDGLTYLWNFGDGSTSVYQNPTHTFNNAGNYSVSLTVTNENGTDIKSDMVIALSPDGGDYGGGYGGGDEPPPPAS